MTIEFEQYAPSWKPAIGESIVGTITKIHWAKDKRSAAYPVLTLKTTPAGPHKGEELAVHGAATALKNKLIERKPPVGTEIGIRYNGLRLGANGEYHSYTVKTTADPVQEELPFSWDEAK